MLAQLAGYYSQGGEVLLLDQPELSGVTVNAAYSLRKLRADATLAIRVRRSSDNAELDVGFAGNGLDTTALLAFCGVGDGFITTAYAQSGSLNINQATASLQPQIVNAGVVEVVNSHPSMRHLLTPAHAYLGMDGTSWTTRPANGTEFFVMSQDTARTLVSCSNTDASNVYSGVANDGSTSTALAGASGTPSYYVDGAFVATDGTGTRGDLWSALAINTPVIVRTTAFNFGSPAWRFYRTKYYNTAILPIEHQFERIIIDGDTLDAAAIAAIEQNQADYYGITL